MTTTRVRDAQPVPDLVQRQFTAAGPEQLWVADITSVPTGVGFLHLAVVLDARSRRVIGWAMETHLRTELVLAALDMAQRQRRPPAVIHHSDHGCQYTVIAFGQRCDATGVRPSMGAVGDADDTPSARVSSPPWNASCSSVAGSQPRPRRGSRSSTSSRAGPIPAAGIPPWATCRRFATSGLTRGGPRFRRSRPRPRLPYCSRSHVGGGGRHPGSAPSLSTSALVLVRDPIVRDRVSGQPRGDGLDPAGADNLHDAFEMVPPE